MTIRILCVYVFNGPLFKMRKRSIKGVFVETKEQIFLFSGRRVDMCSSETNKFHEIKQEKRDSSWEGISESKT